MNDWTFFPQCIQVKETPAIADIVELYELLLCFKIHWNYYMKINEWLNLFPQCIQVKETPAIAVIVELYKLLLRLKIHWNYYMKINEWMKLFPQCFQVSETPAMADITELCKLIQSIAERNYVSKSIGIIIWKLMNDRNFSHNVSKYKKFQPQLILLSCATCYSMLFKNENHYISNATVFLL